MGNKKTYKPKVEGYVPEAIDGDGDGFVQDGTEFERPFGTEFDEFVEQTWNPEPATYVIERGENIQTVADKFLPIGMKRNEYAEKLWSMNKNWAEGATVRLF